MKNTKSQQKKSEKNDSAKEGAEVEVLYQRMGDRWFAFSLVEDEVYVGSLTPEEIHGQSREKTFKITGKA
jgi:hypothetical protein